MISSDFQKKKSNPDRNIPVEQISILFLHKHLNLLYYQPVKSKMAFTISSYPTKNPS